MENNLKGKQSTLFAEESPANLGPLQEKSERKRMTVISGLKCFGLLEGANPDGLLSKMSKVLLTRKLASPQRNLTWKVKVTKQGHSYYQLAVSKLPTRGTESSLWATPNTSQSKETGGRKHDEDVANTGCTLRQGSHNSREDERKDGEGIANDPQLSGSSPRGDVAHSDSIDVQGVGANNNQKRREKSSERQAGLCNGADIGEFWAVEPNVGRVANGVPNRVDRLKQLGNAVIPQIPELIGRAIMAVEAQPCK